MSYLARTTVRIKYWRLYPLKHLHSNLVVAPNVDRDTVTRGSRFLRRSYRQVRARHRDVAPFNQILVLPSAPLRRIFFPIPSEKAPPLVYLLRQIERGNLVLSAARALVLVGKHSQPAYEPDHLRVQGRNGIRGDGKFSSRHFHESKEVHFI